MVLLGERPHTWLGQNVQKACAVDKRMENTVRHLQCIINYTVYNLKNYNWAKLQNTVPLLIIHHESWLIWFVCSFVIHCRAKQATKDKDLGLKQFFLILWSTTKPNKPLNDYKDLNAYILYM